MKVLMDKNFPTDMALVEAAQDKIREVVRHLPSSELQALVIWLDGQASGDDFLQDALIDQCEIRGWVTEEPDQDFDPDDDQEPGTLLGLPKAEDRCLACNLRRDKHADQIHPFTTKG